MNRDTLSLSNDGLDDRFDPAYAYDHLSRLKDAFTGTEAREFINSLPASGTQDGPYRQSYTYDAFSNMTGRDTRFWSQWDSFIAPYTNHRRDGWSYDASGNLLNDGQLNYKWDAAGRNRETGDPQAQRASLQWHDGDGQTIKHAVWQSGTWTEIEYFVRSSVLGGRVITELNRYGQKQKGYVYLGSEVIAEQGATTSALAFRHDDPLTGSRTGSAPNGSSWKSIEADPMGVNVGVADPFVNPDPAGFEAQPEWPMLSAMADGGCAGNPNCTRCTLDGFEIGCDRASHLIDIGAAAQCPNNDCGPRFNPNRDGSGRGGWELPYLTHAGFIFNPLGPSTTPPGMSPPTLGFGRPTNPRPGDRNPYNVGDESEEGEGVIPVLPFFGGLGFMLGSGPQKPDVERRIRDEFPCNIGPAEVIKAMTKDFSKFGNFEGNFGLANHSYAKVVFDNPPGLVAINVPVIQGARVMIQSAFLTSGLLTRSVNVSVTVSDVSSTDFTFTTNRGHVLYPATISFVAAGTDPGKIAFGVHITGNFAGIWEEGQFKYAGGRDLEKKIWKNLINNVKKLCGN